MRTDHHGAKSHVSVGQLYQLQRCHGRPVAVCSVQERRPIFRGDDMKLLKLCAGLCAAVTLVGSLSGCVVVPVPFGHGGGGYYHHYRN
jgi:hypothetical protein